MSMSIFLASVANSFSKRENLSSFVLVTIGVGVDGTSNVVGVCDSACWFDVAAIKIPLRLWLRVRIEKNCDGLEVLVCVLGNCLSVACVSCTGE